MPRTIALRFILVALIAAFAIVTAGLALTRLREQTLAREQLAAAPTDLTQLTEAQLASAMMPLDANGIGAQVIGGTSLNVRIQPYPVVAGDDAEIRLVVVTPNGEIAKNARPEAFIAPAGEVEGATRALAAQPDGSYLARGKLFSRQGLYRIRLTIPALGRAPGGEFDYIVMLGIDAR